MEVNEIKLSGTGILKNSVERRKRLGQYFTGEKLAHLLAVMAIGERCSSAIDPMCGSGDMLAAVRSISPSTMLAGIEIDPNAMLMSKNRLVKDEKNAPYLIEGNAFSWRAISSLPTSKFDLVITNPPYVRYQSLVANDQNENENLPSAESVRRDLLKVAQMLDSLDDRDREIFISIIEGYSGLSDLAVPSWILCAMLTAVGGNLAMVVPDSWLSRDYAYPIHYLLLKFFRIQWVIEDAHRVWFEDAQVKTNLIIAKRVPRTENIIGSCVNQDYFHVALPAATINSRSIVGNLFPESLDPDASFAQELVRLSTATNKVCPNGFTITRYGLESKITDLMTTSSKSTWLRKCEPNLSTMVSDINELIKGVTIPQALLNLLQQEDKGNFTTIEMLGWQVGQGLRTGANSFFYCDLISEGDSECLIKPGKELNMSSATVPRQVLLPVLRKQNEMTIGYQLDNSKLIGRVLNLENYIHPNDLSKLGVQDVEEFIEKSGRFIMPENLAKFVTIAAQTNIGTEEKPKWIPQLSAVRTNETKNGNWNAARFWYMLPPFAKRHIPDLFVPRINNLHPKVMMNSTEKAVIDANFSTLWLKEDGIVDAYALLSCLNSSWSIAAMELIAAVMGGGALKLEATHLKRLPIPKLSPEQWAELSTLGRQLTIGIDSGKIITQIDWLIMKAIFGDERADSALKEIQVIKTEKLTLRKSKG
ncbi:N-6 DNA methylase [Aneurinibacillus sp. UBA3580]|jgi:hypothetical protein|uniref:N-6 DNA methylase n=1 Tax=Aneurinibacillus sp. UBA3580 TaxID=1946041 RepID=UPI0025803B85|nr:N-6 DNA methylase [Aneurinibacillus sp. UBA3580]